MENDIKEKIERWKILADILKKTKTAAYVREINGNLHFCYIVSISEDTIVVENFGPEQRKGKEEELYWVLIFDFDKFNPELLGGNHGSA